VARYRAGVRFYVHGAGRTGRAAWPAQADAGDVFADHSGASSASRKAELVVDQHPGGQDVVVVAHSLGAVPVALSRASGQLPAARVVLLEPALYDLARGEPAIEAHICPMTEARALAGDGDLFGYWRIVAPLMFGREATREAWMADEPRARHLAALEPPWGHGIDASVFADTPTLVVTGDWNPEYEAIAEVLADAGAAHGHLVGARHRPQDLPEFEDVLAGFIAG
jgi:alpha-beta hydrolase superfamily lysophospholipase